MARKNKNSEQIIGRIYSHNLSVRTVENKSSENYGKEFINGTLDVATDDAGLNIIQVHYSYVTPTTKQGKGNASFNALKQIIDSGKTILNDGLDQATCVRLTPSIALNDFYPQGGDELVSTPRHEGGFVTILRSPAEMPAEGQDRNKFECDVLITNVEHVEKDEERGIDEDFVRLKGCIFNFRNDILPMSFVVRHPGAMKYFEDADITPSTPMYTGVRGIIENRSTKIERHVESAFGEDAVDVVERRIRNWVINHAIKVPYAFGDEDVLTPADIAKAMENRNVMLAEVKQRSNEYYNNRAAAPTQAPSTPAAVPGIPAGGFKF